MDLWPRKRGSKACAACRRGKNRCEMGQDGCRRCVQQGIPCVLEAPARTGDRERIAALEEQVAAIKALLPAKRPFPPLPDYPAPAHPIHPYGIELDVPEDDDDTIPAPFDVLAEAAAAAASPKRPFLSRHPAPRNAFPHCVTKRLVSLAEALELFRFFTSRCLPFCPIVEPSHDSWDRFNEHTPFCTNAVLAVAARMRHSPSEPPSRTQQVTAHEAYGIARSTLFAPTVKKEGVMAVAVLATWSSPNWLPVGHALQMALELKLGNAFTKLAEREMLHSSSNDSDQLEIDRDLVVSARIFTFLNALQIRVSLASGRPIPLAQADWATPSKCEVWLCHPLSVPLDLKIVAELELISNKANISSDIASKDPVDFPQYAENVLSDYVSWYERWDTRLSEHFRASEFPRVDLLRELHSARLHLFTSLLGAEASARHRHKKRPPASQISLIKDFASRASQAATAILETCLNSSIYVTALRCASPVVYLDISFAALMVIKLARAETRSRLSRHRKVQDESIDSSSPSLDEQSKKKLADTVGIVSLLIGVLDECAEAKRYAQTIRISLDRFKRDIVSQGVEHDLLANPFDSQQSGYSNMQGYSVGNPFVNKFDPYSLGEQSTSHQHQHHHDSNLASNISAQASSLESKSSTHDKMHQELSLAHVDFGALLNTIPVEFQQSIPYWITADTEATAPPLSSSSAAHSHQDSSTLISNSAPSSSTSSSFHHNAQQPPHSLSPASQQQQWLPPSSSTASQPTALPTTALQDDSPGSREFNWLDGFEEPAENLFLPDWAQTWGSADQMVSMNNSMMNTEAPWDIASAF